ncbi:MAG: RNA polymerase sigma factor [Azonexaceae bacterium]|uniref:RNA polymerase sigma factor n=1 Tax=Azonexus sp. R2A61 TaxID=2744443 RepID=UPI001F3BC48C|nr:RNA polymerase sigma factor [Azonexus sp. R2A61]MCE1240102.1 RNA polymerase sigma factor [Azonexaceae bacterium]
MSGNNLRTLYEAHAGELEAFARRRVGREDSRDVVHDAYLRLIDYAEKTTLENPRAYLYRITANVANDHGSKTQTREKWTDPDVEPETLHASTPGPEATVAARSELQNCLSALDELPEIYRHVFLLHRIDGLSQSEVAGALDIPKRTVERYIAKALAHCLARAGE